MLGGGRTGGGVAASETFTDEKAAESFRLAVEVAGSQWPEGWVKGEGYVKLDETKPVSTEPDFTEVAEAYFTSQDKRIKRGKLKGYTLHRYRRAYVLHLSDSFDGMEFASIRPDDIEDWVDKQIDLAWAPKSIRNWHGLLSSIMKHGSKRMQLGYGNPCEVTDLPETNSTKARQIRFFQHDEWGIFRPCLKEDVHLLVDVTLQSGLRWGEVSALRVGDITFVDDETANIHIVRAWSVRAPDDPAPIMTAEFENKTWILGPPKNKRSRYVVVTGDVARDLRKSVEGRDKNEYVFVTKNGLPWRYPDFHNHRWMPARIEAVKRGLAKHATPHMLRHTTVVWSLAQGVKIEVISEMLGHASIQITYDVYGGLIDLHDPVMAQAMAKAMASTHQKTDRGV
jgi:integrase